MFSSLALDSLSEFALGDSLNSLSTYQSAGKRGVSDAIRYVKDTVAKKGFAGPFHWAVRRGIFRKAVEPFSDTSSNLLIWP